MRVPLFSYPRVISRGIRRFCQAVHEPPSDLIEGTGLTELVPRSLRVGGMPHQVLVIQPYIKWGPDKMKDSTPDLQLDEAVSLIHTLSGWRVVEKIKVPLLSFNRSNFFGKGQLETLKSLVNKHQTITAVFVNVKTLKLPQHLFLETHFRLPVMDKYSIVIAIFKKHATTKEAKLQVALAEIPYIWSRIRGVNESETLNVANVGIARATYTEKRIVSLREEENKIKKEIQNLKKNREVIRKRRKSMNFPVVAVLGYTNAGKTSLIKALTQEESLRPENKLFATLDVTVHEGLLPNKVRVLFVDTIGFVSNIPTKLLEPFVVTLEDALQADIIVVVQDVSHPDRVAQQFHVDETLKQLDLPESLVANVILVGNKCDKVTTPPEGVIPVSSVTGAGIPDLKQKIENLLFEVTDLTRIKIKVKSGGPEYVWLHREAAVSQVDVYEEDPEYAILSVAIPKSRLEKFKYEFIRKKT